MERDAYYIRVGDELVPVSRDVYEAYYSERRRERTQDEKDKRHGLLRYDAWDNEDGAGVEAIRAASPSPEELAVTRVMSEKLRRCVELLDDESRELVRELFYFDKPLAELARETGIPRKTLEYRRDKILARLRRMMNSLNITEEQDRT